MDATCLIFPSSAEIFKVIAVNRDFDQIHIYVQSNQYDCVCPNCSQPARRVHSYYTRKFRDVPAFGNHSIIFLKARKFYCLEDECPVKIFTERFREHFFPYRRITGRLHDVCLNLALQTGGKPSEKIAKLMSIQISDTSLLRIITNMPLPEPDTPYALGIDDWAYKKRNRYGTILVNLENTFGGHTGANNNLLLSMSKLARPYICLFIVLSLFTLPSTGPLLQGRVRAFSIAA